MLDLRPDWVIKQLDVDRDRKELWVLVGRRLGTEPSCPECGRTCRDYDTRERKCRKLNAWGFKTFLVCGVPRVECPEHGVAVSGMMERAVRRGLARHRYVTAVVDPNESRALQVAEGGCWSRKALESLCRHMAAEWLVAGDAALSRMCWKWLVVPAKMTHAEKLVFPKLCKAERRGFRNQDRLVAATFFDLFRCAGNG